MQSIFCLSPRKPFTCEHVKARARDLNVYVSLAILRRWNAHYTKGFLFPQLPSLRLLGRTPDGGAFFFFRGFFRRGFAKRRLNTYDVETFFLFCPLVNARSDYYSGCIITSITVFFLLSSFCRFVRRAARGVVHFFFPPTLFFSLLFLYFDEMFGAPDFFCASFQRSLSSPFFRLETLSLGLPVPLPQAELGGGRGERHPCRQQVLRRRGGPGLQVQGVRRREVKSKNFEDGCIRFWLVSKREKTKKTGTQRATQKKAHSASCE